MKKRNLFIGLLVTLLMGACTGEQLSDKVIAPAKLENVLFDYHLAQAMVNDMPLEKRYMKDLYFDYVYQKHGVTKAEVDSSLAYYARHPKPMVQVYTNLTHRLEERLKVLEIEIEGFKEPQAKPMVGDSVNLWYRLPLELMASSPMANRITFSVPADTNFKDYDHLTWKGEVLFMNDEKDTLDSYLQLAMTVRMSNDSLLSVDTLMRGNGAFCMTVADTMKTKVKKIEGSVYFKAYSADDHLMLNNVELWRTRGCAPLRRDSVTTADSLVVNQEPIDE